MSGRLYSMPHQEELNATVVITREVTPASDEVNRPTAKAALDECDKSLDDETLDNSFFETQDVSAWLEENLFAVQRGECALASETVEDTARLTPEKDKMHEPSDLFSDFESEAPEPPSKHQKAHAERDATIFSRGRKTSEILNSDTLWQKAITLSVTNKLPVFGVFLLSVGTLVAFNKAHLSSAEDDLVPPAFGLLKNLTAAEVEPQQLQIIQHADERYCLSQGMRLGAAVERAASLTGSAAVTLQSLFTDFSQRCEKYQFVPEVYIQTQLTASVLPTELEQKYLAVEENVPPTTAAMIASNESDPATSLPTQSATSPQTIKNIQWRLVKLGFYKTRIDGKGRIDGVYDLDTQAAVNAFYNKYNELSVSRNETEIFNAIDSVYSKQ